MLCVLEASLRGKSGLALRYGGRLEGKWAYRREHLDTAHALKGGPGITQADVLVVNKVDLAPAVGADLDVMRRDALKMRGAGPTVFAAVKHGDGLDAIIGEIFAAQRRALAAAEE